FCEGCHGEVHAAVLENAVDDHAAEVAALRAEVESAHEDAAACRADVVKFNAESTALRAEVERAKSERNGAYEALARAAKFHLAANVDVVGEILCRSDASEKARGWVREREAEVERLKAAIDSAAAQLREEPWSARLALVGLEHALGGGQ